MLFSNFATYLDKLEETSSRLALIDILSEVFKHTDSQTIDKVMYLMQGRVAPFYAPIEIGMADKMVAASIAEAFGKTKEEVLKDNTKLGDLGLVVLDYAKAPHTQHGLFHAAAKQKNATVTDVFDTLLSIANTSGDGSVEKKIGMLRELIQGLDAAAAKHLVRIALRKTRLGIGDPTILDALALGILGDRTHKKALEKAYNETSDLGLIGKTLLEGGLDDVKKLTVTVGRPIRSELCERLPNPEKVFEKMATSKGVNETNGTDETTEKKVVHATYKYDGFRVQIHKNGDKVSMFSRNLEDMTHMFPELIEGARRQIKAKTAILDSEALAYQPDSEEFLPFQETTKRRRKHNIEEVAKTLPLKAFVFDLLYADGKSLIDTPLTERMEVLKKTIHGEEILIPSTGDYLEEPKDLQFMLDDAISKGLEGVVVKRIDSYYEAGGRNFNWIKLKRHSSGDLTDTIDCVILGYIYGRGKRTAFGAGALLVGVYDKDTDEFVTVSKIGTGLSDDEWRSIKEKTNGLELDHKPARVNSLMTPSVWVKPELVIEVLADEITRSPLHTAGLVSEKSKEKRALRKEEHVERGKSSIDAEKELGYALRFPRLVSFRDKDKRPEDATSVHELIEMFNDQGKK